MSHRLYSSPERARHQIDRHADETPPLLRPARPMSQFERQFFEGAAAMMKAAQPGLELAATRLRAAFQRPQSSV